MTEPNLDKLDQDITDILLEHLVLANDNGQPYVQHTDVAVDKIINLISDQVAKAKGCTSCGKRMCDNCERLWQT